MKTVFVVFDTSGGECEFCGVFSTKELAKKYVSGDPWKDIEETVLDSIYSLNGTNANPSLPSS